MLTKFPSFFRFCSKLLYELLPAAIASVVGGLLFSHFAKTPVATPAAEMVAVKVACTPPAGGGSQTIVGDTRKPEPP